MIVFNKATGELLIGSIPVTLGPGFTRRDLSCLTIDVRSQIVNEPNHSFSLGKQQLGEQPFWVVLYFYGKRLESIDLSHAAPEYGRSWDDRPLDAEKRRKAWHDKWLIEQTGNASHQYPWGGVGSDYDPRSDSSSIVIRYRWMGLPWRG